MTVVRYNNRMNSQPAFNNLLSDLFPQMPSLHRDEHKQKVPVNISETNAEYWLDVVAPGLAKEDFKITLDNNLLTISVELNEKKVETEKTIRREYEKQSFKRSFTIDEKMNADAISANYLNGILTIKLPKKAEVKPETKQITIQ